MNPDSVTDYQPEKHPPRLWAILAVDDHGRWRIKDEKAPTAEQAIELYRKTASYEVIGHAPLGTSGSAITWLENPPPQL